MLYIGFKDHSYYVGMSTAKAMYVVEYLEDIPNNKIEAWTSPLKSLHLREDVQFSVNVLDQESFHIKFYPVVKSFGLGTSFSYVDKLILNAIRNICLT